MPEPRGQDDGAGDGAGELGDLRRGVLRPRRQAAGPLPLRRGPAQERRHPGARAPVPGLGGGLPQGLRGVHGEHGQGGRAHRQPGGDQEDVRLCQLATPFACALVCLL